MTDGEISHFEKRWKERGMPGTDGATIKQELEAEAAVVRDGGHSGRIEFVFGSETTPGAGFYRFIIQGVPYYALISLDSPFGPRVTTAYTHDMIRRIRRGKKARKKIRSIKGKLQKFYSSR